MKFAARLMDVEPVAYQEKNIVWMTELPERTNAVPIIVGDRIFTVAEPDELLCLDKATGKILWRQSIIRGSGKRGRGQQFCANHIKVFRGTPYPNLKTRAGRWYVANARIDLPIWKNNPWTNKDTTKAFFCAHLIGNVYRYCNLAADLNPAELDTKDFREDKAFEAKLVNHVRLGDEVQIIKG